MCQAVLCELCRGHEFGKRQWRTLLFVFPNRVFPHDDTIQISILVMHGIVQILFDKAAALTISMLGLKVQRGAYGKLIMNYVFPAS